MKTTRIITWVDVDKIEHNVIKINVKFFFCLIPHYVMRAFRGVELWIHTFFTSTRGGDK